MAVLKAKEEVNGTSAVIAFHTMDAAQDLSGQLDQSFGTGCWIFTNFQDGSEVISNAAEHGAEFFLIGVQRDDPSSIRASSDLIGQAKEAGLKVVLLAEALSPTAMHELMRAGADDFAPLPLPASALIESVTRMSSAPVSALPSGPSRRGKVYPIYGAAGGVGASTLAVNLAWEVALEVEKSERRVAVLDFNFQYGSVATYLDLPRREAIYELLSDTSTMDEEGFGQALTNYANKMAVLTAPMDALPLDIISPEDVRSMIDLARSNYDFIFIDLPQTLAHWSDLVLTEAEVFYALMESDMRSAQNMLRFIRTIKAEKLPFDNVRICQNRSPSFTDLAGKTRSRRLEESLSVSFSYRLPDGGKQVASACDQGTPLAKAAKGNALRKEIRKMAKNIVQEADASKLATSPG